MLMGFLRQPPNTDSELTALEDAAGRDGQATAALLDYLLQEDGTLSIREAGDFCDMGDVILSEAQIKLATKSLRTIISHTLTLDEAGQGAPLPFQHPPVLKVDGTIIQTDPADVARLSRAVRAAWAQKNVVSPLSATKEG